MADINRLWPARVSRLATASGGNRRGAAFVALECFCGAGLASKRIPADRRAQRDIDPALAQLPFSELEGAQPSLDERFLFHGLPRLFDCARRQDRQTVADEDAVLDERPGRPKAPLRFEGVHVGEVLGDKGLDTAGRGGDAVDRNKQRLLQHRRKQFRYGFPGVAGHVGSPVSIR
jgi:hypothetical protein